MGCAVNVACRTCRIWWDCGYGSYSKSWEREDRAPKGAHEGHDLVTWIDDDEESIANDTLYAMGSYGSRGEPILTELSTYDKLDYTWNDNLGEWEWH